MSLLEQHDELLREKIAILKKGDEAGVVSIFGKEWDEIGTSGQRKSFGRLFKKAVREGKYPDIEWVRIENSGRYDVYRKL